MDDLVFVDGSSNKLAKQYHALCVHPRLDSVAVIGRFFLTWDDVTTGQQQFLGDLSVDHCSKPIFLTLGLSDDFLLFYLHLPIKINATSKGLRNVYVVTPVESFNTDHASAFTAVSSVVHEAGLTPELAKAGVQLGTKLLNLKFVLMDPSCVVMPIPKVLKDVNERSRGLLLSLKSLSRATGFHLYVHDLGPNRDVLTNFLNNLRNCPKRTPEIQFKRTYNGRIWGKNSWHSYGLRDDESMPTFWNPVLEDSPPAYSEIVQSAQALLITREVHDTHPDFSRGPGQGPDSDCPSTESPSSSFCSETGTHPSSTGEHARQVAEVEDDERNEATRQSNPQESTEEPASTQNKDKEQHELSPGLALKENQLQGSCGKRKVGEAFSDPETIAISPRETFKNKRGAPVERILEPETFKMGSNEAREYKRGAQVERLGGLNTEHHSGDTRFDSEIVNVIRSLDLALPSLSVIDGGPNRKRFDDGQYYWFLDAALWLSFAWSRIPTIAEDHFTELGILSQAIRLRDRSEYQKARLGLACISAQEIHKTQGQGPLIYPLIGRSQWMIEFIYGKLGPGYDTLIMDDLSALHVSAYYWMKIGGDKGPSVPTEEEEYTRRRHAVYLQMAACLLLALFIDSYEWYVVGQNELQETISSASRQDPPLEKSD